MPACSPETASHLIAKLLHRAVLFIWQTPAENPEQLFAAGWSACFMSAMQLAANKMKVALPNDRAIDAEVGLVTNDGGFVLRVRFNVKLPGIEREVAQAVVDAAHQLCPYSKATRGNIDLAINLV